MNILGSILYECTLLHIICAHLDDLYTLNSLSGWKGLKKFIPRDSFISSLYILFSMHRSLFPRNIPLHNHYLREQNLFTVVQARKGGHLYHIFRDYWIVIDEHMCAFTNMTNLKCIILFYMNINPRIFIIINSIYLFIYIFMEKPWEVQSILLKSLDWFMIV